MKLIKSDPILFANVHRYIKPEMNVWDIGANLGLFGFASAWMAGPQGRVLLLEGDPWLSSLLQRSANGLVGKGYAKTVIACCAVTDRSGPVEFGIAARGRASNAIRGLGHSQAGGIREALLVGGITLDQLLEISFRPDVIKIDIEGAELQALRGATAVLAHRPILLLEVSEESADEISYILKSGNYDLYDAEKQWHPSDRCTWSTVAIPR